MAPTRALINSYSSQHPQHASTGINSSREKKSRKKAGFYNPGDQFRSGISSRLMDPFSLAEKRKKGPPSSAADDKYVNFLITKTEV